MTLLKRTQFVVLLLILSVSSSFARDLEDAGWMEVRSAHFTLRSAMSKKDTLALTNQLELLHAALRLTHLLGARDLPSPDLVYLLQNRRQLFDIGYSSKKRVIVENEPFASHGFVTLADGRRVLVVLDDRFEDTVGGSFVMWPRSYDAIAKYLRFLADVPTRENLPEWYEEGIAQYVALADQRLDRFEMGRGMGNENRLNRWRKIGGGHWYTAPRLLRITHAEHMEMRDAEEESFHAQAWLLVHYLIGNSGNRYTLVEGLQRYADLAAAGTEAVPAFEQAFDIPVAELQNRMLQYLETDCCRYLAIPVADLETGAAPTVTRLSTAEVSLGLGRFAAALGNDTAATHWLEVATKDPATRAEAEEALAGSAEAVQ